MITHTKRIGVLILLMLATVAFTSPVIAAATIQATLYKNPNCLCCEKYANYLEQHGFDVKVIDTTKLPQIRSEYGVPASLQGCHTMLVNGYVVGGHVPVDVVKRMLRERPSITGITLPGMPTGAPGMGGEQQGPFVIYAFGNGEPTIYATKQVVK